MFALIINATELAPDGFVASDHPLTDFISRPDAFSFIVAYIAGVAGVLSLTSAKSGALIGVLVSVTTIPAAANIGVAAAFGDWAEWRGAMLQLALNLVAIVLAGVGTLFVQRRLYMRRRRDHLKDRARAEAGLPLGRRRRRRAATSGQPARRMSRTATDLLILLGAFAGATAVAAALGAANFGTALTFGEIAFVIALFWVMLRSD